MPNIHLTPRVQDFAEREVATGAYADVSEGAGRWWVRATILQMRLVVKKDAEETG